MRHQSLAARHRPALTEQVNNGPVIFSLLKVRQL